VLVARRHRRIVAAGLLTVLLAVVLGAGKFLFYGRHTAAINIAGQLTGGLLGAWLAAYLERLGLDGYRLADWRDRHHGERQRAGGSDS
jgi:hypothetical protein